MIYFIRAVGTPFVKVGFTKRDPEARCRYMQIHCPLQLVVERAEDGGMSVEMVLHDTLGEHHHRGEWFRLTPQQVSQVQLPATADEVTPREAAVHADSIGARIRACRLHERMSQPELAVAIGTEPMCISNWERGVVRMPALQSRVALADFFEVSLNWLTHGTDVAPESKVSRKPSKPRRTRKARKPTQMQYRCSACHEYGHNRRTCRKRHDDASQEAA